MDISVMTHFRWCFSVILLWMTLVMSACAPFPTERPVTDEPPLVQEPLDSNISLTSTSAALTLRPDHPQSHIVRSGDTLWDIAGRFLEDPWLWPEIWRQNPAIGDPHLIFPGDVIELYYQEGQPRLRVASGPSVIKLSPTVRYETVNQAVPTLPRHLIQPFLQRSIVLTSAAWSEAPYIIGATDPRLAFAAQDRVHVRGSNFDQRHYRVFRLGKEYRDPISDDPLGFDAIYVGEAVLEQDGDPATVLLTSSTRQALVGDRLFPVEDDNQVYQFTPHAPPPDTQGQIIAAVEGLSLIGQHQTVVLNVGQDNGVEPGQVFGIFQAGRKANDPSGRLFRRTVSLPDEQIGFLMVYKVYDRLSYGLVTQATRNIRVFDRVGVP